MTLEDVMAEKLAKEIEKSIDFEIIADILVGVSGYTRLDIKYDSSKKWVDVIAWADSNCTGEHKEHAGIWLFEQAEDAVLFKLKWA